jgi:DNA-binding NarL/FixJ family response regulator
MAERDVVEQTIPSPGALRALMLEARVVEMRLAGATHEEIAYELGIAVRDVSNCIMNVLERVRDEILSGRGVVKDDLR